MASLEELFAKAQAHHQARRFSEAEAIYIEILRRDPQHSDALNLLGTTGKGG